MREHQMNEYQCPYCLHGDAEKERLLSHLLNCHPGRPGKVLLRKQITSSVSSAAPCPEIFSSQPQQPPPSSSAMTESDSNSDVSSPLKDSASSDKLEEEAKPVSQANVKDLPKVFECLQCRKMLGVIGKSFLFFLSAIYLVFWKVSTTFALKYNAAGNFNLVMYWNLSEGMWTSTWIFSWES